MADQDEMTRNGREKAVEALIESLQTRFPEKGFTLHPSLQFSYSPAMGMRVIAREAIEQNKTLLVIPKSETLKSTQRSSPKELLPLYKKLVMKYRTGGPDIQNVGNLIPLTSAWLGLRIMKLLWEKNCSRFHNDETDASQPVVAMDPLWLQSDTWPSEDEMKEAYYGYWEAKKVEDIWGSKSGLTQDYSHRMQVLNYAFEELIYPLLKNENCGGNDFVDRSLPSNVEILHLLEGANPSTQQLKKMIRNTFLYTDSIIYTRSHDMIDDGEGGSYHDIFRTTNEGECQIYPLVDLFNGDVSGASVKNSTSVNVALKTGKWPFIGGGMFRNDCNLSCSCVFAIRNIQAGEELILSYGDDSPLNHFLIKYGAVPKSFLDPTMIRCNLRLWCDPTFIPKDPLRIACLQKGGFPLEDIANDPDTFLTEIRAYGPEDYYQGTTSLELYNQGHEVGDIGVMRHFLIVAVLADEYELKRNLNTGKLRGALYEAKVLPLLCRMIDYNLGLLQGPSNGTTSSDDVNAAKGKSPWEASALLARVAYRETLLAWRHAFCKKAMELPEPSIEDALYETAHPCCANREMGCAICGKTYPSQKCGRCMKIRYCCRDHQKMDWKKHKRVCGKASS